MLKDKLLATGIGGAVIVALCCFTPLLVVAFAAIGVSAWLGWIDLVLFPALGFFVLLTVYALYRRQRGAVPGAAGGEEGGPRR